MGVGLEVVVQDVVMFERAPAVEIGFPTEGGEMEVGGDGLDHLGPADHGADGQTVGRGPWP